MGQYHIPVNLDKREFIHPHKLATGLKLWEQVANHPGTGAALVVLLASSNGRDGGDLDVADNWHGPEGDEAMQNGAIDGITAGPMPEEYPVIAARTIGRWAGDRVAIVGDYAEDGDLFPGAQASKIYSLCHDSEDGEAPEGAYRDISEDVCAVIAHELQGRYEGEGWREFVQGAEEGAPA